MRVNEPRRGEGIDKAGNPYPGLAFYGGYPQGKIAAQPLPGHSKKGEWMVPRTLFLGSYPPRECGIATFTRDVVDAFDRRFATRSQVIAVDEPGGEMRRYGAEVIARIGEQDRGSYIEAAELVNHHPADLLNIQHEYGLFGGERGEWLVDLLRALHKPAALTLHTILPEPDETMLRVTKLLCRYSTKVVALSETGKELLQSVYGVDPAKLRVIHHGVPDVPFQSTFLRHWTAHDDLDLWAHQSRQGVGVRDSGHA